MRAAAKNFRDVLVVVEPDDYARVVAALGAPGGPTLSLRFDLARRAIAHTAAYDRVIATTLGQIHVDDQKAAFTREPETSGTLPAIWTPALHKIRDLRYGENPHQTAAWYREGATGFGGAVVHQGKELSFTNLLDLDAAARIVLEFDEPAAVVIKHTNPCGAATGRTLADAYVRAREADALSAFGGIVGLNRAIDLETARALTSTFIEAVVAPGIGPDGQDGPDGSDGNEAIRTVLASKPNLRVVTASFGELSHARDARTILGAWLVQAQDRVTEAGAAWSGNDGPKVVTRRAPTPAEWEALRFAWRVAANVKSNTVIFTALTHTSPWARGR